MDYTDAVAAFFVPRQEGTAQPVAVAEGSPARRLRDACEPVAMHAVWSRTTNERLAQLGLDFLTSYVGGRGAVLGEPAGAVVAAAFAWFEPSLVTTLWEAARSAVTHDRLVQARDESTVASLREVLAGEDPGEVASLLADAVEAADGMGRPLFSGLRADGRPHDAVHRLWWACGLVREHRGDSHVAAAAAAGRFARRCRQRAGASRLVRQQGDGQFVTIARETGAAVPGPHGSDETRRPPAVGFLP